MALLEMNHIRKHFGGLEVIKDISLKVNEGEILSIIGPSGSGKSTMLRCATMLETIDSDEKYHGSTDSQSEAGPRRGLRGGKAAAEEDGTGG